jgi:hypothetical protein
VIVDHFSRESMIHFSRNSKIFLTDLGAIVLPNIVAFLPTARRPVPSLHHSSDQRICAYLDEVIWTKIKCRQGDLRELQLPEKKVNMARHGFNSSKLQRIQTDHFGAQHLPSASKLVGMFVQV